MKEWLPILFFSPVREQHQNPFVYERFFVLTFFFLLPTVFSRVLYACAYVCVCVCTCWCVQILMSWCVHVSFLLRQYMCVICFEWCQWWRHVTSSSLSVVVVVPLSLSSIHFTCIVLAFVVLSWRTNEWTNEWVSEWVSGIHWNEIALKYPHVFALKWPLFCSAFAFNHIH